MVDLDTADGELVDAGAADAERAVAGDPAARDRDRTCVAAARHVDAGERVGVVVDVHVDERARVAALHCALLLEPVLTPLTSPLVQVSPSASTMRLVA